MARKKKSEDTAAFVEPKWTPRYAAVQTTEPDRDVYYFDGATKARVEAKQRKK
jgi:hypothetical protein